MLRTFTFLASITFLGGAIASCGGGTTPADGGQDGGRTVTLDGDVANIMSGAPVGGARVCVNGTSPCATADASGHYTLTFPADTEAYAAVSATGFMTTAMPLLLTADTHVTIVILPDALVSAFETEAGTAFDPARAHLATGVFTTTGTTGFDGIADATITTDVTPGAGPIYLSAGGVPDTTLTATSTDGRVGWMNFAAGGEVELTLTPPAGRTCAVSPFAWPGSTALSTRAPLVAGVLAGPLVFTCD